MKSKRLNVLLIAAIILVLAAGAFLCWKYLIPRGGEVKETVASTAETQLQTETVPLSSAAETEPLSTEPLSVGMESPAEDPELRLALELALDGVSSQWAVSCETLDGKTRTAVYKNTTADTPMISASIIKIFILGAVYDRIDKGLIAEENVYDTCFLMIAVSDNEAANTLIRLLGDGDASVGEQAVNDFAASIGCSGVECNRLMLEDNGMQNYVTAESCAKLLRMIYDGTCISPEASEKMLEILKSQKDHDYIPSGVPEGIEIAHKGGDLLNLCQGDVGIVFAEENPYIVCIICNQPNSFDGAWAKITELSSLIYEQTVPQSPEE